jgi:hypothetical protein
MKMQIVKGFSSAVVFAAIAIWFAGCGGGRSENSGAITSFDVAVENGSRYSELIDTVKAIIVYQLDDGSEMSRVIASVPYNDGKFTIDLPESVDATYLAPLIFDEEMTVSDTSAGGTKLYLLEPYKSGAHAQALLYYSTSSDPEAETYDDVTGGFEYVDRDVTVSGSCSREAEGWTTNLHIDLNLKKGWNSRYTSAVRDTVTKVMTATISHKIPDNIKWYVFAPTLEQGIGNNE